MNWILDNKEWIFSGVGATIIGLIISHQLQKKSSDKNNIANPANVDVKPEIKNEINITNNNTNNDSAKEHNSLAPKSASSTKAELETRKSLTHILFVDDDTKFKIIKILNVAGWVNTKIVKDIENPDSDIVKKSHILFVDINGVGKKMGFSDEGLGLANYLKKKYPEKKIVIYSSDPSGNRFHEALRRVDDFLHKNAEPSEFQELIEQFSAEIELK